MPGPDDPPRRREARPVRSIAPQLIARGRVLSSGRAWLGVELRALPSGGALIASVLPGGPAADAGIPAGDRVISIAGLPTATTDDIAIALAQHKPGPTVSVQVSGPHGNRTIPVQLGQVAAS